MSKNESYIDKEIKRRGLHKKKVKKKRKKSKKYRSKIGSSFTHKSGRGLSKIRKKKTLF